MTSDWTDDGGVEWLTSAGIDLVRGHAILTAPREVTVTTADGTVTKLTATHSIAVCTGSVATLPDLPGLRECRPWTSRDATSVKHVPESLAILGGGVVGVELATAYAGFGTRVDLIARSSLLRKEEPFAGELVGKALEGLGATVHLHTGVSRAPPPTPCALNSTTATPSKQTRSSSPSAAIHARPTSASKTWGSSPATGWRQTTR
jgi:dihydrolipoamide dehydrogenase